MHCIAGSLDGHVSSAVVMKELTLTSKYHMESQSPLSIPISSPLGGTSKFHVAIEVIHIEIKLIVSK